MFARTRKRVVCRPIGAAKTEQKWRDRQDVNSIVARCLRGDNSGLVTCGVHFVDSTGVPSDLQTMLNNKIKADMIFDTLPQSAKLRWKTPSDFVRACHDEKEIPFLKEFGLVVEKPSPPPATPLATPPATPPATVTPNGAA